MQCFFAQSHWRFNILRRTAPCHTASMAELASAISNSRVTRTACSLTFPVYTLFITNVHVICTSDSLNPAKSTFKGVLSLHSFCLWFSRELQEPVRKPVTSQVSQHVLLAFLLITLLHQHPLCACWEACPRLWQHLLFRAAVFCFGACFPPGVSVHRAGQLCPSHWPVLDRSCSDFLSPGLFWGCPCPVFWEFKPCFFFLCVFF